MSEHSLIHNGDQLRHVPPRDAMAADAKCYTDNNSTMTYTLAVYWIIMEEMLQAWVRDEASTFLSLVGGNLAVASLGP